MENKIPDLKDLERFSKLEDQEFKLTKIGSKRSGRVGVGQSETGDFYLHTYEATDELPEQVGVAIKGRGFSYLRTSPIVKIVDTTEDSTTFETEGGIYKVEKFPPARPAPKKCDKCSTTTDLKDMDMKMGGLLCPNCRVILFAPHVDSEYFDERARRYRESQKDEE